MNRSTTQLGPLGFLRVSDIGGLMGHPPVAPNRPTDPNYSTSNLVRDAFRYRLHRLHLDYTTPPVFSLLKLKMIYDNLSLPMIVSKDLSLHHSLGCSNTI